jgi:hypothetical protein
LLLDSLRRHSYIKGIEGVRNGAPQCVADKFSHTGSDGKGGEYERERNRPG